MTPPTRAGAIFARSIALFIGIAALGRAATADETVTYSYDALGRLVKVARAGTANNNASECYAYDPASNRSNVTVLTTGNCAASSFSINNASATEGSVVTFTVTRSGPTTSTNTVQYATGTTGTATSGVDYTAVPLQTLTFGPGVITQTVSVSTLQDALVEGNETFNVNLSNPSTGTTISDSQGVGTIVDNDTATTTVTLSPATLTNATVGSAYSKTITASGGTAPYTFSVTGLPTWLSLTTGGVLSGTPTTAGTTPSFTVAAKDAANNTGSKAYTVTTVAGSSPIVANADFAGTISCGGITTTVNVIANDTGGTPPLSLFSVTAGAGIRASIVPGSTTDVQITSLASSGTKSFSYVVQDSAGAQATGSGTVNVTAPCQ